MKKLTIEDIRNLKPKESILIDEDGDERVFLAEYNGYVVVYSCSGISAWLSLKWQNWTIKKEKKKVVYEAFDYYDEIFNFRVGSKKWSIAIDDTDYKRVPKADIVIEIEE